MGGNFSRGAAPLAILAADFELEDFVRVRPRLDVGVSQEGDETFLEGAKSTLDLALGLGSRCDQVSDAKGAEGALELALGISAVITGTWPEEAQFVGVDDLRDAVGLEGFTEVEEVVPSRVGGHETPGHIETRMVVDREQEGLLARPWPPLVNGTVVLPEFANPGTAKASIDTVLSLWLWDEVCEVGFDVDLNGRTGAGELAKPFEFVADKLVVGRILHGQKAFEESVDLGWPETMAITSACLRAVGFATRQPISPHAIQLRSADAKLGGSSRGIQESRVEFIECLEDELPGKPVDDL